MMLGPVSSENAGAGSGIGRVRAFSLVIRACWCWRGGVVPLALPSWSEDTTYTMASRSGNWG